MHMYVVYRGSQGRKGDELVKAEKKSPVKMKKKSPVKAKQESHIKMKKTSPVKAKKRSDNKTTKKSFAKRRKDSAVKTKKESPVKTEDRFLNAEGKLRKEGINSLNFNEKFDIIFDEDRGFGIREKPAKV